jgi:two-component system chemotaxis response regulator CheB
LGRHQAFHPKLAESGEHLKPTHVYIAPPDSHLLIKKGKMLVTKGAAENRHRPGIDPLFRSAAVSHGSRCYCRRAHRHDGRWHGGAHRRSSGAVV